jgi:SAM-dependent methyltransferase
VPITDDGANIDARTVAGFGREWSRFQQGEDLPDADRRAMFDAYFRIFPWDRLCSASTGMDIGCGSGRWAVFVAPRVGHLHVVDPSVEALGVARRNLAACTNVTFHSASVGDLPVADASLDFAYAIGVLHHVPDTSAAIHCIARKLKPGALLLVYIYYAFDNRSAWYRRLWQASNAVRLAVSRAPPGLQRLVTSVIAAAIYWPLARSAALLDRLGYLPRSWPLAFYRERSFYVMRTDAHDRFCTPLERRFTRLQIETMLRTAGFRDIRFSEHAPFWCAVAVRN